MNEYSASFDFLRKHSAAFVERQAMSCVSNLIVECRWNVPGVSAQWREISEGKASPWYQVSASVDATERLDGRAVSIFLDSDSLASAVRLGGGNIEEGIRLALSRSSA